MTDLAINRQTYQLFLWNAGNGEMIFSQIENKGVQESKKWYDYHELISGKTAVVFVFFEDYDIRREDCVKVATRFMTGDYVRIDIDLNKCTSTETKGINRTNPRQ